MESLDNLTGWFFLSISLDVADRSDELLILLYVRLVSNGRLEETMVPLKSRFFPCALRMFSVTLCRISANSLMNISSTAGVFTIRTISQSDRWMD